MELGRSENRYASFYFITTFLGATTKQKQPRHRVDVSELFQKRANFDYANQCYNYFELRKLHKTTLLCRHFTYHATVTEISSNSNVENASKSQLLLLLIHRSRISA